VLWSTCGVRGLLILGLSGFLYVFFPAEISAQTATFHIVVHRDNPSPPLTHGEISNLFLKKTTSWDHGVQVRAIDLTPDSMTRQAFSATVHRRDVGSIESYWRRQVFSGRDTPPVAGANDLEVLELVRGDPQAVGYVSAAAVLDGVAVLAMVDQPPERISFVPPKYTKMAERAKVSGDVILRLRIDANGNVEDIKVHKDLGFGLSNEAERAASQWKYRPARVDGQAVPTYVTVRLQFGLN